MEVSGVDNPIPLTERCLLIGRRDTSDIVIADESVSTAHAAIFEMDGKRFVRDLGSRTGTFLNGKQVHQAELNFGDNIRVGQIELVYHLIEVPVETSESAEFDDMDDLLATDHLGADAVGAMGEQLGRAAQPPPSSETIPLEAGAEAAPEGCSGGSATECRAHFPNPCSRG